VEADTRLFLAREVQGCETNLRTRNLRQLLTRRTGEFLLHVLAGRSSLLIPNTALRARWVSFKGFSHLRSWSVCRGRRNSARTSVAWGLLAPQAFTQEHLRLGKSLAIPAAVAIQNARFTAQAEIFRAELEQRLADLDQAQKELREVHQGPEPS